MLRIFLRLLSFASIGTLVYYWCNGGQYNTVFLPALEGAITLGLILSWLLYKKVKISLEQDKLTYLPTFAALGVLLSVIVITIVLQPFGSEKITYAGERALLETVLGAIFGGMFLPLGGLGIPLGMVIAFLWPAISVLGTFTVTLLLLIVPVLVGWQGATELWQLLRSKNSPQYVLVYVVYPLVLLVLVIPALSVLSVLRYHSAYIEEHTWQMNHDSYEAGKKIQHALEASVYRGGEFHETFPTQLGELVEWGLIDAVPVSPVDNRQYVYTRDADGKITLFVSRKQTVSVANDHGHGNDTKHPQAGVLCRVVCC